MIDDAMIKRLVVQCGARQSLTGAVSFHPAHLRKFANACEAVGKNDAAELCDQMHLYTGYDCAAAIRARTEGKTNG